MFIDRSRSPGDVPAPPTTDEVAAGFAVPLLTLVAQESVEAAGSRQQAAGSGTSSQTQNQRPVMESATLTYTLWRNPPDRDDPVNIADLTEEMRASLDVEPPWPLPKWMVQTRVRMRYPLLRDAVRTTHISDGSTWHTPKRDLLLHFCLVMAYGSTNESLE